MACNNCTSTKNLIACGGSLILGTITSLNTAIYIFVKSPSGYIYQQTATSAAITGLVTLDLTDPENFYSTTGTFEVWVTLQSGDIESRQDITINSTAYTCFNLTFSKAFDTDGIAVSDSSQTLAIE